MPCPPPGDLPNPGIEPTSLMSPALAFFTTSATWEAQKKGHLGAKSSRNTERHRSLAQKAGDSCLIISFVTGSPPRYYLSVCPSSFAPAVLGEFTAICSYHHQLSLASSPKSWESLDLPCQHPSSMGITWEPVRNKHSHPKPLFFLNLKI